MNWTLLLNIAVLGYLAWAFYCGWKKSSEIEYLNKKAVPNIILKILYSIAVGMVYGAIKATVAFFTFVVKLATGNCFR